MTTFLLSSVSPCAAMMPILVLLVVVALELRPRKEPFAVTS